VKLDGGKSVVLEAKIADVQWVAGKAPVAVVMISLNEGHNMAEVIENLKGWAQEVFLVDSYSVDQTVDIALANGVQVVQRGFKGFGDQWNFALNELPISAPWTMKLDPDERLTDEFKSSVIKITTNNDCEGIIINRRLWFMGAVLPISQAILRIWRTGACQFTNAEVNEHPIVHGSTKLSAGYVEHHDSPNLDHWVAKQNKYTTVEAIFQFEGAKFDIEPKLFGSALQRRMWLKKHFWKIPGRYLVLYLYHLIVLGSWRAGKVGLIWAHLRTEVYRMCEHKKIEIERSGKVPLKIPANAGLPDPRIKQY
jgi:glycosyltransferase involved in cell wall biosynthesis